MILISPLNEFLMVPVWDGEIITWQKILLFPVERGRNSLRRTSCILPQHMLDFFSLFGPSTVIEGAEIGNHLLSTGGTVVTVRAVSVLRDCAYSTVCQAGGTLDMESLPGTSGCRSWGFSAQSQRFPGFSLLQLC